MLLLCRGLYPRRLKRRTGASAPKALDFLVMHGLNGREIVSFRRRSTSF